MLRLYKICTMTARLWYRLDQGIQSTFTKSRIASRVYIKSTSLYTHHGWTTCIAEVELQQERWRETFEFHGLRVSRGKTEYMPCPEKDQTIYIQEKEMNKMKTFK